MVVEGGDITVGLRILEKLVRCSRAQLPLHNTYLNGHAKTIQDGGEYEEGEWRCRCLDTIGDCLTNGALNQR